VNCANRHETCIGRPGMVCDMCHKRKVKCSYATRSKAESSATSRTEVEALLKPKKAPSKKSSASSFPPEESDSEASSTRSPPAKRLKAVSKSGAVKPSQKPSAEQSKASSSGKGKPVVEVLKVVARPEPIRKMKSSGSAKGKEKAGASAPVEDSGDSAFEEAMAELERLEDSLSSSVRSARAALRAAGEQYAAAEKAMVEWKEKAANFRAIAGLALELSKK
jgi:hypothetical protein